MDGDGATIEELDGAADAAAAFENLRLELLRRAVDLSANEGWKRAGCRTLATWLAAYSGIELPEARRIAKVARLAARHAEFATAVLTGTLSYGRAELLASYATGAREDLFEFSLGTILDQNLRLHRYGDWSSMVAHWASLVDQELSAPPRAHRNEFHVSQTLHGGGEVHGWLDPEALVTITAGLEAFMPAPDPADGPLPPRTPAQRRADALVDMAAWGLGGMQPDEGPGADASHRADDATATTDSETDDEPDDVPVPAVRPRSGVTANVVIDLRTFAGDRRFDDLDGLFLPDSVIHYDTDGGEKGPWTEMKPWLTRLSIFRCTQHNMCNPIVAFDESGDRAWSTTYGYLMHMQETKDGEKNVMKHSAIYRDEWQRVEGVWRILNRRLSDVGVEGIVHFEGVVDYDTPASW